MRVGSVWVDGQLTGTCWPVAADRVLTAEHCVPSVGLDVTVRFGDETVEVEEIGRDAHLDVVLLRTKTSAAGAVPPRLEPYEICRAPVGDLAECEKGTAWQSEGFIAAMAYQTSGSAASGAVDKFDARNGTAPIVELFCRHGGPHHVMDEGGNPTMLFAGLSGGPVFLPAQRRVVAIFRHESVEFAGRKLQATPMDAVHAAFQAELVDVCLHDWRPVGTRDGHFIRIGRNGNGTCSWDSTLPPSEMARVWDRREPLVRVTCDFPVHEERELCCALLRLALHQGSRVAWLVRGMDDWRKTCRALIAHWFPLALRDREWWTRQIDFAESPSLDRAGELYPGPALAETIHEACDRWVLDRLASDISDVLDNRNPSRVNYLPERSMSRKMTTEWTGWKTRLQVDPSLLRHFLALMLTRDAAFDTEERVVGAGPETADHCLLTTVLLSLAISVCVPLPPKFGVPGNLGDNGLSAHACGVQVVGDLRLDSALFHDMAWETRLVVLPHLDRPAKELRDRRDRLSDSPHEPRLRFTAPPAPACIIALDWDLRAAIQRGEQEFRTALTKQLEAEVAQESQFFASLAQSP